MKRSRASRLRRLVGLLSLALLLGAAALALVQIGSEQAAGQGAGAANASTTPPSMPDDGLEDLDPSLVRGYEVNRGVTDFPDTEDLSTPEAAYATINRAFARGDKGIWRRITGDPEKLPGLPPADAPPVDVSPEMVRFWLGCVIREVWIYRDGARCTVIAERPTSTGRPEYDVRGLILVDGRWLNHGHTVTPTVESARSRFVGGCLHLDARNDKHAEALEHPQLITRMAQALFQAIRSADYHYFLTSTTPDVWQQFPTGDAGYMCSTGYPDWVTWVCTTFSRNPIVQVELGEVFAGEYGRPTMPYTLTLRDGATLSGDLPFEYYPTGPRMTSGHWEPLKGLDWHV